MPLQAWGEGQGEGRPHMSSQAAAPHPDPLPASGEREKFVEIDNVTHAYGGLGGVTAVDRLTLSIAEGEFAAVVGPSGCGKSTLMKLVTGLQLPQAGSIRVGGAKVAGSPKSSA